MKLNKEQVCNDTNRDQVCKDNTTHCECIHTIQLELNDVVEFMVFDQVNFLNHSIHPSIRQTFYNLFCFNKYLIPTWSNLSVWYLLFWKQKNLIRL